MGPHKPVRNYTVKRKKKRDSPQNNTCISKFALNCLFDPVYLTAAGCVSCSLVVGDSCLVICNGWSRNCTMAAQCLSHMTACFSLWPVLMSYLESCISAAAVRGVHQWQRSFHQVADGERTGLDHLLGCWGELQGGCKQVFLSLLMSYCAFFSLFVDWEMCFPYVRLTWLNLWRAGQQKTPTS